MDVEVCSLLFKVDPLVQIYECCSVFLEGSEAELEVFFRDLHSFDPQISFTKDSISTTAIYLDVTIFLERNEVDDGCLVPQFQVYCKPQFTGVSINNRSLQPMAHKLSSIQAAVTKMLRLPLSTQVREQETCSSEQIADKNELKINVRKFIKRKQLREILSSSRSSPHFSSFATEQFGSPCVPLLLLLSLPLKGRGCVYPIWTHPLTHWRKKFGNMATG